MRLLKNHTLNSVNKNKRLLNAIINFTYFSFFNRRGMKIYRFTRVGIIRVNKKQLL